MAASIGHPSADNSKRELQTDVLVVGGGLGGVAAAFTVADRGRSVILTEVTDWIGGQLTAQAVPPDENLWIEQFGCTATWRQLRDGIRDHYRTWYPLTAAARARRHLNPGAGRVSPLCHEPRVALAVLEAMLAPHRSAGRLQVLLRHTPVTATVDRDHVRAVTLRDLDSGGEVNVAARFIIDATETGELLPLTGAEHVIGFESREDTGEPHAPAQAQPLNMQATTVCFALDHLDGEDHTTDRPAAYETWKAARAPHWPDGQLSWTAPDPKTLRPVTRTLGVNPDGDPAEVGPDYTNSDLDKDLWLFRRIAARHNFQPGAYPSDITLVNWPQNDYWVGPLFGIDQDKGARHLQAARQLSLSLLHWLQAEAPRPDGGTGYPGLRLRGDIVGTADGLAKHPYIRESRRIRAETTIVEQDIALDVRGDHGAVAYPDSVGIGHYRIDLHPSTGGDPYIDIGCAPFQIPLGALLPVRMENLIAGAKNIGTTHITNGTYRMHPVEWNIGEVAGHLAAFCAEEQLHPRQVRATPATLARFQTQLTRAGVELAWPTIQGH